MFDPMFEAWADALGPWIVPAAIAGFLMLVVGFVLAFWIGKRRFGRRNFAGVEEFSSFGHAIGSQLAEGVVGLVGALLVFAGFILAYVGIFAWLHR